MASLTTMRGALGRVLETIRVSLCKLNQIQFEAPWNQSRRGRCG